MGSCCMSAACRALAAGASETSVRLGLANTYLALGDSTMLEPGMIFSVEPGLYDPELGIGSNFSDGFVVEADGPSRQMSRLPWSEEWCLVKL